MASQRITIQCWKCGQKLKDLLLPFSRYEECSHCKTDLHACIACKHYDETVSDACREDRAEFVLDKERANFCDYFRINPNSFRGNKQSENDLARAKLAELFGEEPVQADASASPASAADQALEELKRLFGDEDQPSN